MDIQPQSPDEVILRKRAIEKLIGEVRAARAAGTEIRDDVIVHANPKLLPELQHELDKLGRVAAARAQAEQSPKGSESPADGTSTTDQVDGMPFQVTGYSFLREIGRGGQGVVYLARQHSTGRRVAIKVLADGPNADGRSLARFEREVKSLAAIHHPNIVAILDAGQVLNGTRYIVMDYVDGKSLDEYMLLPSHGDSGRPLRLFIKICSAVHFAHQQGIIHRDLKPSNIRIDELGEPHILDFGLARSALGRLRQSDVKPISITGEFLGSLPWCSPEQAEGNPERIDFRSDVYSLGVILYQLITGGRFPYEVVGNLADVLHNIVYTRPTPPSELTINDEVTEAWSQRRLRKAHPVALNPEIEAIVLKALEKDPGQRYQSADALANAIDSYLAGRFAEAKGPSSVAPSPKLTRTGESRQARRMLTIGIAAFSIIGLCLLLYFTIRAAVLPSDSQRIVGKWQKVNPISSNLFLEFFPDGTFTEDILTSTRNGKYKVLSGGTLQLEQEGQFWGTNTGFLRYQFIEDELVLTPQGTSGVAVSCKRVR
jgi:serine/threonine protein kinase